MKKYIIILILFSIIIAGCANPIGRDRDEHGCKTSSGYTWCETKQKCLRTWEDECPKTYDNPDMERAVRIAEDYVKQTEENYQQYKGRNLRVTDILPAECPGFWSVDLEYYLLYHNERTYKARIRVTIEDWQVVKSSYGQSHVKSITAEECLSQGGKTVSTAMKFTCIGNETNIGEVEDFISPYICCKHIK